MTMSLNDVLDKLTLSYCSLNMGVVIRVLPVNVCSAHALGLDTRASIIINWFVHLQSINMELTLYTYSARSCPMWYEGRAESA